MVMMDPKNKFLRIYQNHPRLDFNLLDEVYEAAWSLERQGKDVTKTTLAGAVGEPRVSVARKVDQLERYNYLRRRGSGKAIPFYKIVALSGQVDFERGRFEVVRPVVESNLSEFKEPANKAALEEMLRLYDRAKISLSKFLDSHNKLVERCWQNKNESRRLKKVELNSTAVRYEAA